MKKHRCKYVTLMARPDVRIFYFRDWMIYNLAADPNGIVMIIA